MVKSILFVFNTLKYMNCFIDGAIFEEQVYELVVKQVVIVETGFDDEGKDLMKVFCGSAVV
jgi:hypothetical protein